MSEHIDIFCKIIHKEIPADVVAEGADWIAIRDIHPQTPVHILLLPKRHIPDVASLVESDTLLMGSLIQGVRQVAQQLGIDKDGYRIIINQGEHAGQVVPHVHVHLLGGRHLGPKIVHSV